MKSLTKLLIIALLTGLTTCSCLANKPAISQPLDILIPEKPVMLPVRFEDKAGGLWLSYEDYRNLENNIIALQTYAEQLEICLTYYQGGVDGAEEEN